MKARRLLILTLTVLAFPCFAQQVEFMGRLISSPKPLLQAASVPEKPGLVRIYRDGDEKSFLNTLDSSVEILSTPTVTTRLKQRAMIQVVQPFEFQPTILGNKNLLKPDWIPNPGLKKTDLGFTLECEALNVFENKVGIYCRPSVRTLLGFQERAVPADALKEPRSLHRSIVDPPTPLLRTAEFQVLEADVSLHMRSGALALIYLGRDDQEIGQSRYLYVLVKTVLAPQVSSV